jgi:uncharacterized protein (DUF2062 family)
VHKLLGENVFHPAIWQFSRQSVAGGIALGLFVAITPTVPFQMLLATILAHALRVNLPMALLMCWTTNPFTLPLLFWVEYKIGEWILSWFSVSELPKISQDMGIEPIEIPNAQDVETQNFLDNVMGKVPTLILGSFVLAITVSALSYFAVLYTYNYWLIPKKWKKESSQ